VKGQVLWHLLVLFVGFALFAAGSLVTWRD
jgi:hypothetical protein